MRGIWIALLLLNLAMPLAFRAGGSTRGDESAGEIRGRVVVDGDSPVRDAVVTLRRIGSTEQPQSVMTDGSGGFRFIGIAAGAYQLTAEAPDGRLILSRESREAVYRAGDEAKLVMVRGGVITGRVMDGERSPVSGLPVCAVLVGDRRGEPVATPVIAHTRTTDDRGVYRLFGLEPGTYLVVANPGWMKNDRSNPYANYAPVYHPDAGRERASAVSVGAGSELTAVDIRYERRRGHSISGRVDGVGMVVVGGHQTFVQIFEAKTNQLIDSMMLRPGTNGGEFWIGGLEAGEYWLEAIQMGAGVRKVSPAKRVTIAGGDVEGISLKPEPMATVSGRIVIERDGDEGGCAGTGAGAGMRSLAEAVVRVEAIDGPRGVDSILLREAVRKGGVAETGDFRLDNLRAGAYSIEVDLPGEGWRLKRIEDPRKEGDAGLQAGVIRVRSGEAVEGMRLVLDRGCKAAKAR